ncbi:hypothetical protein Y032_0012g1681 [Ancylostoma ceylanicum]|uniref:Uncharacterized protein n=1 Tax=Ancylostoma ceylanicum TaxID=53326 RepID=A0A016VCE9_9BILA|nr:hypothetical protein Y032_0012g1681 [Ancylostoma ceylanicum]
MAGKSTFCSSRSIREVKSISKNLWIFKGKLSQQPTFLRNLFRGQLLDSQTFPENWILTRRYFEPSSIRQLKERNNAWVSGGEI